MNLLEPNLAESLEVVQSRGRKGSMGRGCHVGEGMVCMTEPAIGFDWIGSQDAGPGLDM